MFKRSMLCAVAAAALIAMAVPAVAAANVQLTNENEEVLPIGSQLRATSGTFAIFTGSGNIFCSKFEQNFELEANGSSHVVLRPLGGATIESCKWAVGGGVNLPVTMTSASFGELTMNTAGEGIVETTMVADVPSASVSCHFSGGTDIEADDEESAWTAGFSVLSAWGQGCPTSGTISASLFIEDSSFNSVTIDLS